GYSSTYGNADRDGDVINKGAFDESLCSEKPIALWQHDQSQPIGIANVVSDNKGLNTELLLPKNDQFVNSRVIPQLEIGAVKSFSIGMSIPKSGISYKNRLRYIEKAFLREVSLVSIPANPKAIIESIKSVDPYKSLPLADDDTSWDSSQAVKSIRHYTNSKESPSADYKRAFMWLDPENDDNFTSYKMPFATVVDGELKAVPRALSAIVGVLN
ncbi:HK97 family phage prohead protease, partial [Fangia hongkongensis]